MALIRLAQADPTIAVLVRTESAESPEARKAWSVVWDRLSPVTTVVGAMVLTIGMMPATGRTKTLEIQGFERPDFAYSVYYVRSRRALDVAEHENLQSMVACHEDGSQPFQKLTAAAGVAVNHRGTSSRTGGVSTDALESAYPLFHSIGPPIAHHGA
ncbi:DUF3693 domain-containing protein [Xanthomonas vasicola]|nr:DUF3693 domain-containing protein [Xanthomonas vasicola]